MDQHWVNFAPVYYDNVLIDTNPGYNVAYWNLHERYLRQHTDGTWFVRYPDQPAGQDSVRTRCRRYADQPADEPGEPLQFFHYSGYNPEKPDEISKYQTRYGFADMLPEGSSESLRFVDRPEQQRPDVRPLFDLYRNRLLANHNNKYRAYPCVYIKPPVVLRYQRVRAFAKKPFLRLIALLEA